MLYLENVTKCSTLLGQIFATFLFVCFSMMVQQKTQKKTMREKAIEQERAAIAEMQKAGVSNAKI